MSRYFFNIFGNDTIFDDTGTELDGAQEEVRCHMLATALAILRDQEGQKPHWQIEALDESGQIIGGVGAGNQLPSDAKEKASGSPEVKDKGKSSGGAMQKSGGMEKGALWKKAAPWTRAMAKCEA